jgi:hypothetical protein
MRVCWWLSLLWMGRMCVVDTQASSRLVITFETAGDNKVVDGLEGYSVAKQYGRRLVLKLEGPYSLQVENMKLRALFKNVQAVEADHLVGIVGQKFDDAPVVANASDPDVDGASIDSASQTPLWNLMDDKPYSIHAESAWHTTNSTPDVVVAVLDTGIAEQAIFCKPVEDNPQQFI